MFKDISDFISSHIFELLITILIFSNIFPLWVPSEFYYAGAGLLLYKTFTTNTGDSINSGLYYTFIVFLVISTIIEGAIDLRLVVFCMILTATAPHKNLKWHLYKRGLMRCFYWGFVGVTLINFYAKLIGYNHSELSKDIYTANREFEFSGFAKFPMWVSAAAAISTIFCAYKAFGRHKNKKLTRLIYLTLMLISIYMIVISASRSALALALGCSLLLIIMSTEKITSAIRNFIIIGGIAIVMTPFLIDNSGAIQRKMGGFGIQTEKTSRDELWSQRMEEFESSPIWGIGYAAHGVGDNKIVGRNESGGGFISVLAQSGIIGVLLIAIIWISATMMPNKINVKTDIVLVYCTFAFFTVHSIVEGYMYQAGWYLCIIIWLVIGLMIEYKKMGNQIDSYEKYTKFRLPKKLYNH